MQVSAEQKPVKSSGFCGGFAGFAFLAVKAAGSSTEQVTGNCGHSAVSLADTVFLAITACLRFAGLWVG